jgi:HK97 family phage portal protein
VTGITGEIYDRVATALQIPPALLKGNVADVEAMTENFVTFSIDPIAKMIERENNRKRYGKRVLNGSKMIIDTSTIKHMDAFSIASSADKMIASGAWSIDDVRRKANDVPLGEDWSQRHYLTKNYGSIDESSNETTTEEVEKGDLGNA